MLKRKEPIGTDRVETIIGKETVFTGKLVASGTLRVDGRVEGEIISQGDVVVGEGGQVTAQIQARNLLLAGRVKGNVTANGRLEIAATGRLEGDVQVGGLVVEDGAVFLGNCSMTKTGEGASQDKSKPIISGRAG